MLYGKKLIEIRRAAFVNKGAELMLYAVYEKLKEKYPDANYVMETSRDAPYIKRARLGFYQKPSLFRYGIHFGSVFKYMPKIVRDLLGIVTDEQIDIVIDAAGFAYSDQWGTRNTQELASSSKRWKKNGTKVVLMPQAFGPFNNPKNKKNIAAAIKNVDLLFARDKVSYDYLKNEVKCNKSINISPDFTNLVKGTVPSDFDRDLNKFCIVPNYRMVDKTEGEKSDAYLPFMIEATRYAHSQGQKPFILVHEGEKDLMLANKIRDAITPEINIITETDPLKIKGILGVSTGTVGSRFHGLVSALSQGVPALATGWSHKYQMLFEDYGFPEGLLDVQDTKEKLHKTMDILFQDKSRASLNDIINTNSKKLKKKSEDMWKIVFEELENL